MVHYFVSPLKGIVITSINFLLSPLTWFLTIFLMVEGINRRKKPMGERQGNPTPDASCETFVLPSLLIKPGAPTQPYDKIGASTATGVVLRWEAGPSNGKAITEFELWWKKNDGEWEEFMCSNFSHR